MRKTLSSLRRLAFLPALGRGGITALAVDILHMSGYRRESREARKISHKSVHFVAESLRHATANLRSPSCRVISRRQRHMQEAFPRIACHMRMIERHDGMFEIAQVNHRN